MSIDANAFGIVIPTKITDAMLVSTNIVEDDYDEWDNGDTYALGDRVILTSTHKIYESLQNGNTNKNPVTEKEWWVEVSPTNQWKLFDDSNSTQTVISGVSPLEIEYVLQTGSAINAIGLLNLKNVSQIQITMVDSTVGTVYDETVNLLAYPAFSGWYEWFFTFRRTPRQYVATDLPAYPNAEITVVASGISGEIGIGVLILGQQLRVGYGIKLGARTGIQDYSRKETNEFGETVLVQRAFAKRANFDLLIDSAEIDPIQELLADIRATPVLFIGATQYDSTVIFGFYKQFDVLISYPTYADCQLEIEGLT
jgi:hypothetical protein